MSEMVERMARALYLWQYGKDDWDAAEPEEQEDAIEAARSAIEAMREPTGEMLAEGPEIIGTVTKSYKLWQAMIDAALGQPVNNNSNK